MDSEEPAAGIRQDGLEMSPDGQLVVVLTGPLGCPSCGRTASSWNIPPAPVVSPTTSEPSRGDPGE